MQQAMELLTPWLTFLVILIPVFNLERWIHRHLYGVGWLVTQDKQRATILYYLILLPGIALHEFTQWFYAGVAKLKTSKIKIWPKPLKDGTLRLDFVKLSSKKVNKVSAIVFEVAPILVGIGAILFISQRIMDTDALRPALATGDLDVVLQAFGSLFGTPDFWLWLYLLFAIGNGMVPTDKLNSQSLLIAGIAISAVLLVIGLLAGAGQSTIQIPLAGILNTLATASGTILILDIIAVVALGLTERVLERLTGKQARYPHRRASKPAKPEPGGEAPLPAGQAPERITERRLPIPEPPKKARKPKAKPQINTAPATPTSSRARASWVEQQESLRSASQEHPTDQPVSPTTEEETEDLAPIDTPENTMPEPIDPIDQPPESEIEDEISEELADDNSEPSYVDLDDIA